MKKLFLSLTLICSSALIYADTEQQVIGPYGTLNNRDNSAVIADSQAQDLLNVDLTPGGKSIKKRKGYGQAFSTTITTAPIHGTYDFFDLNGNDIALAFNDTYLTASISGSSPSTLFSNGPNGVTYQCTDSQGFAYCADAVRDRIIKTDGVTVSNLVVVTTGTMVAVTPDRLVQAGFAGAPNRIDFSAATDFTSWITGVAQTSAFQFTITAPGSGIKHITYAFNRIMWFKDSSFGYILPGATAADWVVKTISPIIGTFDNSSVYWQDVLYFKSQDGNFYSYNGSSLQKISREIAGTIALIQKRAANSWSQSSQGEFAAGYFPNTVYMDTVTNNGAIQFNYPDTFSSLRDGTSGTKTMWQAYPGFVVTSTLISVSNGNLVITSSNSVEQYLTSLVPTANYKVGTTFYVVLSSITPNALAGKSVFSINLATSSQKVPTNGDTFSATFGSVASNQITLRSVQDAEDGVICLSCGGGVITVPATISIFLSTTNYQITANGTLIRSGAMTFTNGPVYPTLSYFGASTGVQSAYVDTFDVSPETGTYYSQVKNAPNLTSWDSFSATYQNNGGSHSFFIRASSNTFATSSSTPSWTSIIPGSIPSISTGTFFQVRDDLSLPGSGTANTILQDFTQNWFEGAAADKSYATYFNDSILFSVPYGMGASANNRILKYDLLNNGWLVYDIASNGFFLKNLSLYFGGSGTGLVYKYGDADDDNGTAINSYWKSKDFIGSDPFADDQLTDISVYGAAVSNSSMTVTYTLNGSTSTSFIIPLYRSGQSFFQSNRNLPLGLVVNSFNVKFGNNAANQPFEVIAAKVGITSKSWKPNQ